MEPSARDTATSSPLEESFPSTESMGTTMGAKEGTAVAVGEGAVLMEGEGATVVAMDALSGAGTETSVIEASVALATGSGAV